MGFEEIFLFFSRTSRFTGQTQAIIPPEKTKKYRKSVDFPKNFGYNEGR